MEVNKPHNKNFDLWNEKKKRVDEMRYSESLHFHEREVWWCSVGINVGVEIDGKNRDFKRPVLIVKKFNRSMFWGIPLTSQSKTYPTVMTVKHGLGFSFANLAQMRLFSSKRVLRKVDLVPEDNFKNLLVKIRSFLE